MKKISKTLSLFLVTVFITAYSFGQSRLIVGSVRDNTGAIMVGVPVVVKGTTHGTVTDIFGAFSLLVPLDSATLVVSAIGCETQEIPAGSIVTHVYVTLKCDLLEQRGTKKEMEMINLLSRKKMKNEIL